MSALASSARVLIADADAALRRQLHKRLLQSEVSSDCVGEASAAAQMIREHSYEVVLVDLSLPGATAESILDSVLGVSAQDRPVVLVLAAATDARTLDVEVVQIVVRKPCDLEQVAELVRSRLLVRD